MESEGNRGRAGTEKRGGDGEKRSSDGKGRSQKKIKENVGKERGCGKGKRM